MKLVDTSSWVHLLRRNGNPLVASRVRTLLANGDAAWCEIVRLELWNGVGGDSDRKNLRALEGALPVLPITDDVWQEACELADLCRKTGKTVPAQDLLIAACARHYGLELEHDDNHYGLIPT